MAYAKVVDVAFKALRHNRIVWKKLDSEFVYKCQSGIPRDPVEGEDIITKDNFEEKMVKFFLQFSRIDTSHESKDSNTEIQPEYLCSFIWIKGNTTNFSEFVSKFNQTVQHIIEQ